MSTRLNREVIEIMIPALSQLASLVGNYIPVDRNNLQNILIKYGIRDDLNILDEFESWFQLLLQTQSAQDNRKMQESIIMALQERGIPEAPATLAVERAIGKPVTCDKEYIEFRELKPGEGANTILKLSVCPKNVYASNGKLKVTWVNSDGNQALIKVILAAGRAGEQLRDTIIIQSTRGDLSIPVFARWQKEPARLQVCPICEAVGTKGEGSLFYDLLAKAYVCLNPKCRAFGNSPDKLFKPDPKFWKRP
jgi:hypothetical protein